MAEENYSPFSSKVASDESSVSSGNDFYLLTDDDIASAGEAETKNASTSIQHQQIWESSCSKGSSTPVDVEAIKKKAEELAKALQSARSKVSKNTNDSSRFENRAVRDDLKQHHERSLYVEKKLEEDRKLFEESKKRSEAVFDKVLSVKRLQETMNDSVRELNRKDDDNEWMKQKIQRFEDTILRLQETLANKNRVITEKNEQIRTLNQSVSDTHDAYMHSLEQSEVEIGRVKDEYNRKIDEISNSKEQLCNQLQLVRKNYLILENDLKLSDFARSRLVSKNSELRERIVNMKQDDERLVAKPSEATQSALVSTDSQVDSVSHLRSKIENLVIIANEFSAFLADDVDDIEELNMNDDVDVSQSIDAVGDKLEAAFFTMRDKLSLMPTLQSNVEKMSEELRRMDAQLRNNKQQFAHMQQQLSATQAKLNAEVEENTRLAESLRHAEISQHLDDVSREIETELDSPDDEMSLQHQLRLELRLLNEELQSKSNEIQALASANDDLRATVQNLQDERMQMLNEIERKSNDCQNARHAYEEVSAQLQLLQEERSQQVSLERFQQITREHQLAQQTCAELRLKCDDLAEELQVKCEQLDEKLSRQGKESFEKEENDFVVLQSRDCDLEDENNSLKQQCAQLREENDKLVSNMRAVNEKAMEYENERLTLQQYINECGRLNGLVDQLSQELTTKDRLLAASTVSGKTDDDRDEEIEGMQGEMAKLAEQLNEVWNQLHDEKTDNHNLRTQLGSYENTIATMRQELQERNNKLEALRESNEELMQRMASASSPSDNLNEFAVLREHATNLEKTLNDAKYEHHATKNELQVVKNSLLQVQAVANEAEDLKRINHELETERLRLSQMCQQLQASYDESLEALSQKDAELSAKSSDAERAFQELHEALTALNEAQCDLQFARADLEKYYNELEHCKAIEEKNRSQLEVAQEELHTVYANLNMTESSFNSLLEKHNVEVDALRSKVVETEREREILQQQCKQHERSYESLKQRLNQVINVARSTSDDAIQVVHQLQTEWPACKSVANADTQCDTKLGSDLQFEMETYEALMEQLRIDLAVADEKYKEAEIQLKLKDDKCNIEIERYRNLLTTLQSELADIRERLALAESELLCKDMTLKQQADEYQEELKFIEAAHLAKCQEYERQINIFYEPKTMVDASEQTSNFEESSSYDINVSFSQVPSKFIKADTAAAVETPRSDEVLLSQEHSDAQPATGVEGQGLIKYFDYYKGKVAKGLTEMLSPEDQPVDYSNWILPNEPISRRQYAPDSSAVPLVAEVALGSSPVSSKVSISSILDRLQNVIAVQMDDSGWDMEEDSDWNSVQLHLDNAEFVDTALKFVDLFELVIRYYASLPATDAILKKFGDLTAEVATTAAASVDTPKADILPKASVTTAADCSIETIEEVVTLTTRLENENKHLIDAITFVEELMAGSRSPDAIPFQSVIDYWHSRVTLDDDIIDRICEKYDIVPKKFVPGDLLVQWREQLARCVVVAQTLAPQQDLPIPELTAVPAPITDNLQILKKKMHKLICDLHYVYKDQDAINPVEFFEQIEDINYTVEATAKLARGVPDKVAGLDTQSVEHAHEDHHEHVHKHDEQDHDHDEHDHEHDQHVQKHDKDAHEHHHDHPDTHGQHQTPAAHDHRHHHQEQQDTHEHDQRDTVAELKSLLGESNKKIDSLVKELMEVKSCREYNEVRQLHLKLDETLYQLHLRDVHVVELTRELAQLLAERDALQLKLSNIIRQNEQLREMAVSNAATGSVVQPTDLKNKLDELNAVNYMKDPRISETSKQYHATGMQLYNEEQKNKQESSASIVPSILKWFTGDTENK